MASRFAYHWTRFIDAVLGRDADAQAQLDYWRTVAQELSSRPPTFGRWMRANVPPWVTQESACGGIPIQAFAAGEALQPFERKLLRELGHDNEWRSRSALNRHFLEGPGRELIIEGMHHGRLVIRVPEEAAIPICLWLQENGRAEQAKSLLSHISPWFELLRFYPTQISHSEGDTAPAVVPKDVAAATLRSVSRKPQVVKMNEAIHVWAPLYDQAVSLLLETVKGETPGLLKRDDGILARGVDGQPIVIGGMPCSHFPADWTLRAGSFLTLCADAFLHHVGCARVTGKKENFTRLHAWLGQLANDPTAISESEKRRIRNVLGRYVGRYGVPQSEVHAELRRRQLSQTRPLYADIAHVVADRLTDVPDLAETRSLERCLAPVADLKYATDAAPVPVPSKYAALIKRTLTAPLPELARRELVPSLEVCGKLMPSFTAAVCSETVRDRQLREVYGPLFVAFHRRDCAFFPPHRKTVRFAELPWVSCILPSVESADSRGWNAAFAMRQLYAEILRQFPHQILPNHAVREFRALQWAVGLQLPLLLDLDATMFRGAFVAEFLLAAQHAGRMLRGTLYERYYDISYDDIARWTSFESRRHSVKVSPEFLTYCLERAAALSIEHCDMHSTAFNRAIIEQAHVVTTHNLVMLIDACNLRWSTDFLPLAERTLVWICQQLQRTNKGQLAKRVVKNVAYAWRQMIFYLTLAGPAAFGDFVRFVDTNRSGQFARPMARLQPALLGLQAIAQGERFDASGLHPRSGGRRLYGWSFGSHWLAAPEAAVRTLSSSR